MYCETLWASFRPSLADSRPPSEAKASAGITSRCRSREDTSEVMSAAEEPRPVLCTSDSRTPVCKKGGSWARDLSVAGRLRSASCGHVSVLYLGNEASEIRYLSSLGIKVVVASYRNVEAVRQGLCQCLWALVFPYETQGVV